MLLLRSCKRKRLFRLGTFAAFLLIILVLSYIYSIQLLTSSTSSAKVFVGGPTTFYQQEQQTEVQTFKISTTQETLASSLTTSLNLLKRNVHFFFFGGEFRFHHYLAIRAAFRHLRSSNIMLHYFDQESEPRSTWLKKAVSKKLIRNLNCLCCLTDYSTEQSQPLSCQILNLTHPIRKAIARLDVLQNYGGGVYLDLDVILLRPIDHLLLQLADNSFSQTFIIAKQGVGATYSLPMSFIIASQNASFTSRWYEWFNVWVRGDPLSSSYPDEKAINDPGTATRILADMYPSEITLILPHRSIYWPLPSQNGVQVMYLAKTYDFLQDPNCIGVHLREDDANVFLTDLTPRLIETVDTSLFCAVRELVEEKKQPTVVSNAIQTPPDYQLPRKTCCSSSNSDVIANVTSLLKYIDPSLLEIELQKRRLIGKWRFGAANNEHLPKFRDLSANCMDAILSPLNGYKAINDDLVGNKLPPFTTLRDGDHIYIPVEGTLDVLAKSFTFTMELNMDHRRNTEQSRAVVAAFEFSDCTEVAPDDVQCSWLSLNVERPYDGTLHLLLQKDEYLVVGRVELTALFSGEWHNLTVSVSHSFAVIFVDGIRLTPHLFLNNAFIRPPNRRDVRLRAVWLATAPRNNFSRNWPVEEIKDSKSRNAHYHIARASLYDKPLHDENSVDFQKFPSGDELFWLPPPPNVPQY